MKLVTRHWSGKHGRVIQGINLTTLLWSDGDKYIPCDYRLYEKSQDGQTKNDHFRGMLTQAKERGFEAECVVFDRMNQITLLLSKIPLAISFLIYGLSQVRCVENGNLVFVYGPQDSLICATPNSRVSAGYYDVDQRD